MPRKKRVPIPDDIKAQILFLNEDRCCVCHKGPKDGVRIQINHINEDPSDNRLENLAVLCRDCHDRLNDRLWMGERLFQTEVKKYKELWERAVSEKRKHLEFPSAIVKERILEKEDEKGRIERQIEREINYTNGLAPQAFGISPPVRLSQEKKIVLEEAKQIATSQPSSEKLLPILNNVKKTAEIKIEDMVVLSRICLSIGDSKFHAKDYSAAEIFYREALNYAKSAKELGIIEICLYELGASVGMQGRHQEALDYFNQVIKMNKNNADAWFNKSVALSFLNKKEAAISAYRITIDVGTKASSWGMVASAYYNMGYALDKLKRYEEAVNSYLKAVDVGTKAKRWSTVANAYYNMGNSLHELKRYEEAVNSYLKAVDVGTKVSAWGMVASAYYNMGNSLDELKRYEEAVNSYLKAVDVGTKAKRWSTVASAYYNMGNSLDELKRYEEAVNSYLKAIGLREFLPDKGERIFPTITRLICFLGIRSVQNKNYNQARILAKKLSQVYLDGKKDGMAKLQVKTMEEIDLITAKKEEFTNAFQEFKKLFEKSKKRIRKP